MQEIPDTSDKFGLDCIVDGSIPAGNLDNNELCVLHIFIHGRLYRWTENSFPFFQSDHTGS